MLVMYHVTSYSVCVQGFYLYVERVNVHLCIISLTMGCVADFIASSDMKM